MRRFSAAYVILTFSFLGFALGQMQGQTLRNSVEVNDRSNIVQQRQPSTLNFRIESGKCWINGNLVQENDLPAGLRNLDNAIYYQTAVFGINEISFQLYGKEYVVKAGRVAEVAATNSQQGAYGANNYAKQQAAEEYYSQLKRESPGLFYSISREGALYEQCRSLLIRFQKAKGKDRAGIREEMRTVLGQLFEINEHNRELEIQELEQMIESAKKEVMFRKANKGDIINSALKELLDE